MPSVLRKMIRRGGIVTGVAALVGMGFLHGLSAPGNPVPTATVKRENIAETLLVSGVLQPRDRVDVGSQVSGQLTSLKVHAGDSVTKGQLLGEIDPVLSKNALLDAQMALDSLQAQEQANEALLNKARLTWQRQKQLLVQYATPRQDLDTAEADMRVQLAQLSAMKAQIRQQQIRVVTARTNLAYTRIIAPISGTVVSVTTQEGQTVVASYQVPVILQIADLSTMTVRAQIPEADIGRVKTGMPVCFTTLGEATKQQCSTFRAIGPAPDKINNALFFNALFDIPNPDGALRPDMTALVTDRAAETCG